MHAGLADAEFRDDFQLLLRTLTMTMSIEKKFRILAKIRALGVFDGGKMLTGNYIQEAVDPEHRPVLVQNQLNSRYKREFQLDTDFDGDFYQWLKEKKKAIPGSGDKVAYLTAKDRLNFLVTFSGKRLVPNPKAIIDYREFFLSVRGELIFVLAPTPQPNLYVGAKAIGTFHHSSLYAGRAVLAAGTMLLDKGVILQVNNHSGHYKPGLGEMVKVVEHMRKNGALVDEIVFKVSSGRDEWTGSGSELILQAQRAAMSASIEKQKAMMSSRPQPPGRGPRRINKV